MRKKMKKIVAFLAMIGILYGFPTLAAAEEEEIPEFELNQVIVTALRTESTNLDTPASVTVLNKNDLDKTGNSNIAEALQFTPGVTYYGMGSGGQSWGGMNTKVVFRSLTDGTLVMLNGVPLNMENQYNLDDIPAEMIEKVEVIKGGGSTLYGSEATGGVINIITKKNFKPQTSIKYQFGNFGYDNKTINWQDENIALSYSKLKTGAREQFSEPSKTDNSYISTGGTSTDQFALAYKITDKLRFNYSFINKEYAYSKVGAKLAKNNYNTDFSTRKNNLDLIYEDGGLKITGYYHNQDRRSDKIVPSTKKTTNTLDKYSNLGFDIQNTWQLSEKNSLLTGFSYKHDDYANRDYASNDYKIDEARNNYAIYLQDTYKPNDKLTLILGGRGQIIKQTAEKNASYHVFTPQLQTVYKLDEASSWYTNIAKVFKAPTLKDLYNADNQSIEGLVVGNPDLEPDTGWNYETGYKKITDKYALETSLFYIDMSKQRTLEKFTDSDGENKYKPINLPFRNIGLEVNYKRKINQNWSYNIGGSISDPKQKDDDGNWQRVYARLQLTTGIAYDNKKFNAALNFNYLGDRVDKDPTDSLANKLPPTLNLNFYAKYRVNENNNLVLAVDNLLDRENKINHTADSIYYSLPLNYRLSWEFKF